MGRFDPDGVRAGLRGLTHDDGQPDGRWERRERFPIDIFGQDGFEDLLPELVRPDFALLSNLLTSAVKQILSRFRLDQLAAPESSKSGLLFTESRGLEAGVQGVLCARAI